MTKPRPILLDLLIDSIRDPRGFAPRLVGWPVAADTVWAFVLLMSVLSTLLVTGLPTLLGVAPTLPGTTVAVSPIAMAGVQVGAMALTALLVARIGAAFGGTGGFDGALRCVVWLQFVMVVLNIVQFLVMLVLSPMLGLVSLASLGLVAWVGTGLVAGLHGFKNLAFVLVGIFVSFFAIAFAMAILAAIFIGPLPT